MSTPKPNKTNTDFKKKLRAEYERLKTLQESQEKEIIVETWIENRYEKKKPSHFAA